jgi:large-conductance mechanosensitive channel
MKRNIKTFIVLLLVLLIPTGCMKIEANFTINKDKSADYSLLMLYNKDNMSKEELDAFNEQKAQGIPEEYTKELSDKTSIDFYEDDESIGYKLSTSIDSIDVITSVSEIPACDLMTEKGEIDTNHYCFYKEKGLFYDTYKAKIKRSANIGDQKLSTYMNNTDDSYVYEDEDGSFEIDDSSINEMQDMAEDMMEGLEYKFVVNTPFKIISNNADEKTNGKLIWDIMDTTKTNDIEFAFRIPNTLNIIIGIVVGLIIAFLTISVIISYILKAKEQKNNNNNNKPEEQPEEIEMPQQTNAKINALLSEDGSDINNFNQ